MRLDDEELNNLSDDILTSFDFHHNNYSVEELLPEKRLMYSILIFAIIDYLSENRKSYYRDARKWFNNKEMDYIYSFHNICFTMGVNPNTFRSKLKKLKRNKNKFALDGKRITN
jgi:hypothetical protein